MQKKKIHRVTPLLVLGVLCVAAMWSVSSAQERRLSTDAVSVDYDQDGLSNREEQLYGTDPNVRDTDGDGYSDGVEVQSGFDPLVPSSEGDRLGGLNDRQKRDATTEADVENLTARVKTLVAGVAVDVASGKEVKLDDAAKSIEDALGNAANFDTMPQIDVSQIHVKKQDYDKLTTAERRAQVNKDVADYVAAMGYIVSVHAQQPLNDTKQVEAAFDDALERTRMLEIDQAQIGYFQKLAVSGQKMLAEMRDIQVPEVMIPLHVEGMQLATYAVTLGTSVTEEQAADDPMVMIVAMTKAQALMARFADFSTRAMEAATTYGVTQ